MSDFTAAGSCRCYSSCCFSLSRVVQTASASIRWIRRIRRPAADRRGCGCTRFGTLSFCAGIGWSYVTCRGSACGDAHQAKTRSGWSRCCLPRQPLLWMRPSSTAFATATRSRFSARISKARPLTRFRFFPARLRSLPRIFPRDWWLAFRTMRLTRSGARVWWTTPTPLSWTASTGVSGWRTVSTVPS